MGMIFDRCIWVALALDQIDRQARTVDRAVITLPVIGEDGNRAVDKRLGSAGFGVGAYQDRQAVHARLIDSQGFCPRLSAMQAHFVAGKQSSRSDATARSCLDCVNASRPRFGSNMRSWVRPNQT